MKVKGRNEGQGAGDGDANARVKAEGFHNPFGVLSGLRDRLPESPPPVAAPDGKQPPKGLESIARAVVRMERAGRGGKEATVIEQMKLSPRERESWLKALKAALGCGGVIEGDAIMLQGDHRERLKKILSERGVKKVIIG